MKGRVFGTWSVKVYANSLLFLKPQSFGPWVFETEDKAQEFVYHLFAPSLVAWARLRLLEWPAGCVDPPDAERLELLRDYRMLCQLHDCYRVEKDRTGFNYWTWLIRPAHIRGNPEEAAADFLRRMQSEFADFQ